VDRRADAVGDALTLRDGTVVRLALDAHGDDATITARDDAGRVVGRVASARVYGPRATVTLDVDAGYRHRGLAEALLASLCLVAAGRGISRLLIRVPATDLWLLALLREQFAARETPTGAFVDAEVWTGVVAASGWNTEGVGRFPRLAAAGRRSTLPRMSVTARPFASLRVADVMHAPVVTCGPETPITAVAREMADRHLHAVVVTGIEGTAWGVVTALDLAAAAATATSDGSARDIAATEPVRVSPDMPLSEAARVMVEHQVNHVLVADADGRPAGVVSTADVARGVAAGL
jgi:CBS domain-containing protein/GNAT superfamily N-acetyltransferase